MPSRGLHVAKQAHARAGTSTLPHNFSSGGALQYPVCIFDGALWGPREQDHKVFDFSGKRYFRVQEGKSLLAAKNATWHDRGILSWLSCEENLNHFIGETLAPVFQAIQDFGLVAGESSIILTNAVLWPEPHPDGCSGNRFTSLLRLMPTAPQVLLARSSTNATSRRGGAANFYTIMPPSLSYDVNTQQSVALDAPHCFRRPILQTPSHGVPGEFYRSLASRASRLNGASCAAGLGYSLIVQRAATRRITNVEDVKLALRQRFELPVKVVTLELLSIREQMEAACGARIVLGASGQGLEWAHFLNGGSSRGLVIELFWPGWPCYYKGLMEASGLWVKCAYAYPLHRSRVPKHDDVHLNASKITRDIQYSKPGPLVWKHREAAAIAELKAARHAHKHASESRYSS